MCKTWGSVKKKNIYIFFKDKIITIMSACFVSCVASYVLKVHEDCY